MSREDILQALQALKELHQSGVISEDEFAKEKAIYLQRLRESSALSMMATAPPAVSSPHGADIFATGAEMAPEVSASSPSPVAESSLSIQLGSRLMGRYELQRLLGEGGMGRVFLALDTLMGQLCALKLIHPALAQEEPVRKRFIAELALTQTLTHPGIIRSYSLMHDTTNDAYFFTMEYV